MAAEEDIEATDGTEGREPDDEPALEELLEVIHDERAVDLTGYKRSTLRRRVVRRMKAIGIADGDGFAAYADRVREDGDEMRHLLDSLLINVTSFFRDTEAWDFLRAEVIPRILRQKVPDAPVRVWSAGCASGEEPFSVAILLAEELGLEEFTRRVKIYATDWDEGALQIAWRARYERLDSVPDALRARYFQKLDGHEILHNTLRRAVIFGQHDLVEDAPISRVDLLLCRNTLMYFKADTQSRILARLHFALDELGYLFLGRAEMLLGHTEAFLPFELRHRIFMKQPAGIAALAPRVPPYPQHPRRRDEDLGRALRLREAALDASPVAQVVLDSHLRVGVINHKATLMFHLGPADLGRPLQDLELSYRPVDLRSMIDESLETRGSVVRRSAEYRAAGRESQFVDVEVTPTFRDGALAAITITLADVTHHHKLQENLQRFSENLETAYEEVQSANEELETTNEELQSSNEELETTNEELQAANEEMETVNEELRSTNEELQSTNEQLRRREDELASGNVYLHTILGSMRVGVVVLDDQLLVRVWNDLATDMWGLRPDEVIGGAFATLDIGLPVARLLAPIRECLDAEPADGASREMIVDCINRRGKEFTCRVIVNRLQADGVVMRGVCVLMEDASRRDRESGA